MPSMTTYLKLFYTFIFLLSITPWAQADQNLDAILKASPKWVVLGFVADSEKIPTIEGRGHDMRKQLESRIQELGGEIHTMSLGERLKWERKWSLPFKGRLSKELLEDLAEKEKVNLLTGSYPSHSPTEISYLVYDHKTKKSSVIYETLKMQKKSKNENMTSALDHNLESQMHEKKRVDQNESSDFIKRISTRRQRPLEKNRRRQGQRNEESRKLVIKEQLSKSQVMKDFIKPYQKKTRGELENEIEHYIEEADKSWFSSTKIEMLSRAWKISTLIPGQEKLQANLLQQLAEHNEFASDWDENF